MAVLPELLSKTELAVHCTTVYIAYMNPQADDRGKYRLHKSTEYDPEGNIRFELEYDEDESPYSKTRWFYLENSLLAEKDVYFVNDDEHERVLYYYDEKGRVIEEASFLNHDLQERTLFRYDEASGEKTEEIALDAEDNVSSRTLTELNEEGKVVRKYIFADGEDPEKVLEYEYDADGHLLREVTHKLTEDVTEFITFEYDAQGRRSRSHMYNAEGELQGEVRISYDDADRPIRYESETFNGSRGKLVNQMTYDERGNLAGSEFFDLCTGALISRESFTYDAHDRIQQDEVFEVNPDEEDNLTWYRRQYVYEYWLDESLDNDH